MSSNSLAVSARNLSKSYTIAHNEVQHSTLAEAMLHRVRNPLARPTKETFWALKDVSFEIQKGDVVGIIGRNGAGKSTLLKVLSRITSPTTGELDLYGRVGSLLEVGTGFHPELTGRENVYLNGAILGMAKSEIRRQFDAIVDFAGVANFLDTPVKRYSSGMYVRLAFAVAAHLQSEILIVDEVLAVGDSEFQRKCLGKMKDVAQGGRTVLFVSHHMQSIQVLCTRGMFLERGKVTHFGSVSEVTDRYVASFQKPDTVDINPERRPGSGEYRFSQVQMRKEVFKCGEPIEVQFEVQRTRVGQGSRIYLALHLVDESGVIINQCDSRLVGCWYDDVPAFTASVTIDHLWLKPGGYRLDLFICASGLIDGFDGAAQLNIAPTLPYPNTVSSDGIGKGLILSDFSWTPAA